MKTLQDAAEAAIAVQSACNLSGVVHSFHEAMNILNDEAHKTGKGTDWTNNHPICRLFAEQISHLTRNTDYYDASRECEKLAQGEAVAV